MTNGSAAYVRSRTCYAVFLVLAGAVVWPKTQGVAGPDYSFKRMASPRLNSGVRSLIHMVRLNCSGIMFGSQLDEKHLFSWALEIPCVLRWEQDQLVVRSLRVSKVDLHDLIALLRRYNVPMQQLVQFRNSTNEVWFTAPGAYWHQRVFGQEPNLSPKRTRVPCAT